MRWQGSRRSGASHSAPLSPSTSAAVWGVAWADVRIGFVLKLGDEKGTLWACEVPCVESGGHSMQELGAPSPCGVQGLRVSAGRDSSLADKTCGPRTS